MHGTRGELTLTRLFKLLQTALRHARLLHRNTLQQSHDIKASWKELFLNHKPAACETKQGGTEMDLHWGLIRHTGDWSRWRARSFSSCITVMWPLRHVATFDHRRRHLQLVNRSNHAEGILAPQRAWDYSLFTLDRKLFLLVLSIDT